MARLEDSYKDGEATRVTVEIKFCKNDVDSGSTEFLSQLMKNMSDMKLELQKRAAIIVETISKEPCDMNEHLDALKKEAQTIKKNACGTKNPVIRLSFEEATNLAFF
ncbi:hypothetical protein EAF04_008716 [Stromatinia cepivora]|nr:hypothetical protein EAF04_008716 [Stromatinia cepivora]